MCCDGVRTTTVLSYNAVLTLDNDYGLTHMYIHTYIECSKSQYLFYFFITLLKMGLFNLF